MSNQDWHEIFSAENFSCDAHKAIEIAQKYLHEIQQSIPKVLPTTDWQELFAAFPDIAQQKFPLDAFVQKVVDNSQHLHHPNYIGHQVAVPLPIASVIDFIASLLNNSTAIIEMGPCHTVIEQKLINWMAQKIGYSGKAGGFITSGGSLGNLMALLAARQAKSNYDVWEEGVCEPLTVLVSDQAHYCVSRATQIMGFGRKGAIQILSDNKFSISKNSIEVAYQEALKQKRKVIAVVGSCCNTGPGTFENLNILADFCEKHDLWFHVDGAHGAPVLLSQKYKHLAQGISRADSVVWDLHKMMMMPSLCTGLIFRKLEDSYAALHQKAPYLYGNQNDEKEWYAISRRTMECTKPSTGLKAYFCLQYFGEKLFASYLEHTFALAQQFAQLLEKSDIFEYACLPQGNIICFRVVPKNLEYDINKLQMEVRNQIIASGEYYIVSTILKGQTFLRITIMNPLTTISILESLLAKIESIVENIL